MSDDTADPLIEAALTATEGGSANWDELRERMPGESQTIDELAALVDVFAAYGGEMPSETADAFAWGPLEVRRRIGGGSFGDVYVAWDPRLQREVALKLRRAGTAERTRRWLEEARRLARVRHPNVVTVHGAAQHDGRAGIWMDFVRGRTLEERLRHDGPLGAREAALVGVELCGALAAVHAEGLVHGDVKTHNVVREGVPGRGRDAGRLVLMDFGSAHESSSEDPAALGTPRFSAPEVLAGGRGTAASDLWSLGVVLYRLATDAWPIEAATLTDLRERLAKGDVTPLRAVRSELPAGFVAATERALAREPERRWGNAAEFERELLAVLGADAGTAAARVREKARRRRWLVWGRVAVAGVVLALVAWLALARGPGLVRAWRARSPVLMGTLAADQAGPSANAFLGSWVIAAGDVNGDGHEDVLAAASGVNQVELMTPDVSGLKTVMTFTGEHPDDDSGISAAGDFNGDGHPDIAIGAFLADGTAKDAGRVAIYWGGAGLDTIPDLVLQGTHAAQYFGYTLSAGDVNGDGIADLIVGAPYDRKSGPLTGRAWVYFGGPHMDAVPDLEVSPGTAGTAYATCVSYLGDVNGDGYGDFTVAANANPGGGRERGAAYVYFGGPHLDDRADLMLFGKVDYSSFGTVRRPCGDVNGDGYADIAVASERGDGLEPRAGTVFIYYGGPDLDDKPDVVLPGEHRGDGFGVWVDGSRDVDGDGMADVLVGAPWNDGNGDESGRAYVFLGGKHMDDVPDFAVTGPDHSLLGFSGCFLREPGRAVGSMLLGLKNESRATTQCGALELTDLERWAIRAPGPRDGWAPGRDALLSWTGPTPAEVALSFDSGATWRTVARRAGGHERNDLHVRLPAGASDSVAVRLSHDASGHDAVTRTVSLAQADR